MKNIKYILMKKIAIDLSIAALAVLVMSIGLSSLSQEAYAGDNKDKKISDKETVDGEFHQAVIKTDDKKYKIDGDYDVQINDDDTYFVTKNSEARDIKDLKLRTGEDITIKFKCPDGDCRETEIHGDYDAIIVYIVDKDEKNIDIALRNADRIQTIADERCDEPLSNCIVETDIPNDIDEGKYKLVINTAYDEGNAFFINKVKIKE
jgi:hypothetical protein